MAKSVQERQFSAHSSQVWAEFAVFMNLGKEVSQRMHWSKFDGFGTFVGSTQERHSVKLVQVWQSVGQSSHVGGSLMVFMNFAELVAQGMQLALLEGSITKSPGMHVSQRVSSTQDWQSVPQLLQVPDSPENIK